MKKTENENDKFLFGYAAFEVLLKRSREGRNRTCTSVKRSGPENRNLTAIFTQVITDIRTWMDLFMER